jgi:hypothetical protein
LVEEGGEAAELLGEGISVSQDVFASGVVLEIQDFSLDLFFPLFGRGVGLHEVIQCGYQGFPVLASKLARLRHYQRVFFIFYHLSKNILSLILQDNRT